MTYPLAPRLASLPLLTLACAPTARGDLALSGFATLGGAISDQDVVYQTHIDDRGTLDRDSLLGIQLDAQLAPGWGLTIQGKAAPSDHREDGWDPQLSWAFLSWRPSNDLLLRAGKLRIPLMLYSANSDVGMTFDFARLPYEVYSLAPTADVTGASLSWNWLDGERDWTLDGYLGYAHTDWRIYLRDGLPPEEPPGAVYRGADITIGGVVLTLHERDNDWRIGLHRGMVHLGNGSLGTDFPYVALGPGIGYYQVLPAMPGPGTSSVDSAITNVVTAGADIALPRGWRMIGEYVRRDMPEITTGTNTNAAYLALLRSLGRWTPYVYVAGIRSEQKALDRYQALNRNRVPATVPDAATINASQRLGADQISAYDQYSWAIGGSYKITHFAKLKAEWLHVRSGRVSSVIDAPTGEDSGDREVNVFSLSLSAAF